MKSIIILYKDENSLYGNEKAFDGKSSYDLSKIWAESFNLPVVEISNAKNVSDLFGKMLEVLNKNDADFCIYTYADLPFLNKELTEELITTHTEYSAEYTFADGYPYGFSPELLDKGTLKIMETLCKDVQKEDGEKAIERDSIFSFIKKDINAYEIESVLADNDWRLFRYNFSCGTKEHFMACKALFEVAEEKDSVEDLSKKASENPKILKTIPAYYNIQISDSCSGKCSHCPYPKAYEEKYKINPCETKKVMDFDKFSTILNAIKDFSDKAVINLSAWGDPLRNPDLLIYVKAILQYEGLSVFIETDGTLISETFCNELKTIVSGCKKRNNKYAPVMIAVSVDAFSDATYKVVHGEEGSVKALAEKIKLLNAAVPCCVYPQFVRMNSNEDELESFYRYWNEKSNESSGNLIIQKYNDFADLLPECKPADLSPLDRNVCWHLRRDMTILSNGDVPLCSQYVLDGIIGNAFNENLQDIWKKYDEELMNHICGKYKGKCGNCDEFYTFNF